MLNITLQYFLMLGQTKRYTDAEFLLPLQKAVYLTFVEVAYRNGSRSAGAGMHSLGLFLDVDLVLTDKAINLQYAQLLGIEHDLISLERSFRKGEINNDQFNAVFIPLFRGASFTRQFAEENFDKIQMKINADDLIRKLPDTFIVTSGPSYFIDKLAAVKGVPKEHVLCSRYEFEEDGTLKRCIKPSTSTMKGSFVREHAKHFDLSIGVGDSEQDIEFLSHCDLRVLMSGNWEDSSYLTIRELQPIIDFIDNLQLKAKRRRR
jgi:phosphoserine phosphatase